MTDEPRTYLSRHDGKEHELPLEPIGRGSKHEAWEASPDRWLRSHKPDLTLWCGLGRGPRGEHRKRVAKAWQVPDGTLLIEYLTSRYRLDGTQPGGPTNVLVHCPDHGPALVPAVWIADLITTRHSNGNVLCADPTPVYAVP